MAENTDHHLKFINLRKYCEVKSNAPKESSIPAERF